MRRVLVLGMVWGLTAAALFSEARAAEKQAERGLKAGAAIADITPPLGELIVGNFTSPPAKTIHDKLHARCLVLDNGEARIAFVICDNVGIVREVYDEAREQIAKETSFPAENILMAATHSHSATRARLPKYRPIVVRGIVQALKQALKNLEPAKIGWGGVDEPSELFNRRWYVTDPELLKNPFGKMDKVRMNPPRGNATLVKPAGPTDPEISFLSVRSKAGRPMALLASYSLHYVGGVKGGEVSADYFAIFANRIGELLNAEKSEPSFVGILTNGTSGDVNNINFREKNGKRYEPYEKMQEVAEKVAQRVKEAEGKIAYRDWVKLGSARRELTLKVRKPDAEMRKYLKEVTAKPDDAPTFHRYEKIYAERVQALDDGPAEIDVPLQVLRIGDLAIAAIPFEVFTETGLEIKDEAPFADAFTIELANSSHGYLPTPRQHELGGYETWMGTNRVEKDASQKITQAILGLMQQLKK